MDTLEGLEKLARRARAEAAPVFGVAEAVRRRIRSRRPAGVTLIPLGVVGGLSAVAASIIVSLAVELWSYMSSPVMELVAPLPEIPLW